MAASSSLSFRDRCTVRTGKATLARHMKQLEKKMAEIKYEVKALARAGKFTEIKAYERRLISTGRRFLRYQKIFDALGDFEEQADLSALTGVLQKLGYRSDDGGVSGDDPVGDFIRRASDIANSDYNASMNDDDLTSLPMQLKDCLDARDMAAYEQQRGQRAPPSLL